MNGHDNEDPRPRPLKMKWRLSRQGMGHINVMVFLGEEGQTLQNAGHLALGVGEYQLLAAVIGLGAKQADGNLVFEVEGEARVLH